MTIKEYYKIFDHFYYNRISPDDSCSRYFHLIILIGRLQGYIPHQGIGGDRIR